MPAPKLRSLCLQICSLGCHCARPPYCLGQLDDERVLIAAPEQVPKNARLHDSKLLLKLPQNLLLTTLQKLPGARHR